MRDSDRMDCPALCQSLDRIREKERKLIAGCMDWQLLYDQQISLDFEEQLLTDMKQRIMLYYDALCLAGTDKEAMALDWKKIGEDLYGAIDKFT